MPSSTNPPSEPIVSVGVPVPGLGLLSYRIGAGQMAPPKGARVAVPLGARRVVGCVVDPAAAVPDGPELRDVIDVLDDTPFLPSLVVDLALWVGDYYASGPGSALAVAMPPAARGGERTSFRAVERARLSNQPARVEPKGAKQRVALDLLSRRAEGLTLPELLQAGVSVATIRSLARRGLVGLQSEILERDPFALVSGRSGGRSHWALEVGAAADRDLTSEQAAALDRLEAIAVTRKFQTVLLHGVTGSGKTELYLRLARIVRDTGRRVLVLLPEIGLTPALAGQFRARFGDAVAIQHSGLSIGERHDQWHRIRRGQVGIVVGTRSAVFAPLENIGLIVVDEEHDTSYKQEEAPRYHGRDVAVVRGRLEQALVVLGTATPSLESAENARSGRYARVALTRRVFDRPLADVQIVDMRKEFAARGPAVILSAALAAAIQERLDKGEQSVVLLNRRGFATVIFCRQCGASLECPHCSVALTYHRAARRVRCHYCNYATSVPARCGVCGGEYLEQSGFGTERVEAEIRAQFPEARVARVDRDTTRRRGAMAGMLTDVARGVIDVVVGTQMIAKGHDFPSVTLAGVIAADVGLGLADFRASERTFQLLTQVVGRAGRGVTPGKAIVQSLYPDHYAIRAAATQDYAAFFDREMEFRSKMRYPPVVALINVVVRHRSLDRAMAGALALVKRVRELSPGDRVVGPAPAALSKIRDHYRAQFFVKSTHRTRMREAIRQALDDHPELRRTTIVDVDPVSVT